MNQVLQRIKDFKKSEKNLEEVVKLFIKDKEIDLEVRWKVFKDADFGDETHEKWYFNSLNEDDFHENEYIGQIIYPDEVIEWFKDNHQDYGYEWDLDEEIKSFKEECMEKYIRFWYNPCSCN